MPNRILKESIKYSDQIDSLTWFEEVVFYRLMVSADDYGCYDGRMNVLKNELFPAKDNVTKKSVEDAISHLASVGLLCQYTVSGKPYLFFPSWEKHQRVRNKKRKFPEPPENLTANCGRTTADCLPESNPIRIQSESESESGGGGGTRTREAAAPAGFVLPPMSRAVEAFCNKINPTPSQRSLAELESFEAQMGSECCLRAIDEALDARKASWNYIRAILRSKLDQGVRCIADWDNLERKREEKTKEDAKNDDRFYR